MDDVENIQGLLETHPAYQNLYDIVQRKVKKSTEK